MPCNLLATSGVWGQASSRAGRCHGPVICAVAQSAVLRRSSYLVQCSAVTLLTAIEQGALNFHSARAPQIMQPVLVNSQEPDLQEAWVHRDTKTLRGGDPACCQSSHSAEAFVSTLRALAAAAHRTLDFPHSFATIRWEALCSSTKSQTGSAQAVAALGDLPTLTLYLSWLPAPELALDTRGLLFSRPRPSFARPDTNSLFLMSHALLPSFSLDNLGPTRCGSYTTYDTKGM